MKRYVSVNRSAAGKTTVTVTLVDGEMSAKWSVSTYIGDIQKAVGEADTYARKSLEEVAKKLECA